MEDDLKYRVIPREVIAQPIPNIDKISLTDSEKKKVETSCINAVHQKTTNPGCFIWGVGLISIVAVGVVAFNDIVVWFVPIMEVVWFLAMYGLILPMYARMRGEESARNVIWELEHKKAEEEKRRVENANQSAIQRVNYEANSLTKKLIDAYRLSAKNALDLPLILNSASDWLRRAQAEYNASAFAPFWDAVEYAAMDLATFNDKTKDLSSNANEYYNLLKGKNHTFPAFPANISMIPDVTPVVNELYRIVRLGQTNFQFATIWEHRKTREVLIAGFRTIGEAVNNIGRTTTYSVSNLQQAISSDVAKLVEEEIKTRDTLDYHMIEQNQMLDNIQNRRKPEVTDSPRH